VPSVVNILTVTIHPAIDKIISLPCLRPNDMARARIDLIYGGGKGNNVARALTRLNVSVIATGFQGGYSGEFITRQLAAEGIQTDFVVCQQPTRTTLMINEEETGRTYAIYEPGQEIAPDEVVALKCKFHQLLDTSNLCLLCGSAQTTEAAAIFPELIEIAQARGVKCILDSSGLALAQGICARPHMVKVNSDELSGYLGRPLPVAGDQVAAMQDLQTSGIQLVAMTRGSQGILMTNGAETWQGVLKMERVINVMGCGDSLLAGIAMGMVLQETLPEIIRLGVACGAANTQAIGAGFINQVTVASLRPFVQVSHIALDSTVRKED
jgi:tagatose 6-phosphate kinase